MIGYKNVVDEGRTISDPGAKKKVRVTGEKLCIHLYPGYEPHFIYEDSQLPTAECKVCNKEWDYDPDELKFVEK